MIPRMRPSYRPVLYRPDGYARFRQYPRQVDTPIPGAGYDVEELAWAEQELDLNGGSSPSQYGYGGRYGMVPLRGLGQPQLSPEQSKAMYTLPLDVSDLNSGSADEPSGEEEGGPLLSREGDNGEQWVSKPLLWGLGLGVFALGGAVWWMRRRS